ncbi:hypothetical protein HY504_01370 [Candidatus Wolfebacteria bacterium]|nr:hypothetical protein [Candidatus Wolfebacteria bacterium]
MVIGVFPAFYAFILALILALLEIQIEGRDGWAKNLPAWRPKPQSKIARWYRAAMSGKELTGYHSILFAFVLLIFFFPYAYGFPFVAAHIIKTVSLFFLFIVLWDFLWFVLNPHYPLKKFTKEHVWWHKEWCAGLPVDYYYGVSLSFTLALVGSFFVDTEIFFWWAQTFFLFCALTAMVVLFTLYILDIDNWQSRPRG